jgi:hypothetical protein
MAEIVTFDVTKNLDELEGTKLSDQAIVRLGRPKTPFLGQILRPIFGPGLIAQ